MTKERVFTKINNKLKEAGIDYLYACEGRAEHESKYGLRYKNTQKLICKSNTLAELLDNASEYIEHPQNAGIPSWTS